jgi:hypothetical protein
MIGRVTAALRAAPATVPALAAVALLIAWATDQAGYPVTHWGPGGLIMLALLGVALGVVGLRASDVPPPVRLALACLAAFTALSYLSILWAGVQGDAWEGANRTLLYLIVFALFACWPKRGAGAMLLLGTWIGAMIGLGVFVALHLDGASSESLQSLLPAGRLVYPSDYVNADAAQWLMAFWPALLLARSARLPWGLRGVLAAGAVLLAELALLSVSRGALYATPVMLLLVFALLSDRARTFAVLVPVAIGIGAAAPAVLRVGNHLKNDGATPTAMHGAIAATFAAALVVGLVVAAGARIESRRMFSGASRRRIRRGVNAVAISTLVAIVAGGLVVAGNPVTRIRHGWDTFKGGYAANGSGNRLISGLGSNRYDFYRVALDEFLAHPVVGIGADNFAEEYLVHGHSDETPHYPHSVELRTLADTGLVGMLLALVGLGAALLAGARACRSSLAREDDPLRAVVAAAALGGFAYWAVHGSVDWFWEFAGLGGSAFALLGLACSLAPSTRTPPPPPGARRPRMAVALPPAGRRAALVAGVLVAVAAGVSLAAPWLSQLEVQSAARIWTSAPQTAYARLRDAARLNPLSDEAYLVAGSIALRYDDLARAGHEFSLALGRSPGDAYATLELGAIASTRGERNDALELLRRADRLQPREPLTRAALALAQRGGRVNVEELNRAILLEAQRLR